MCSAISTALARSVLKKDGIFVAGVADRRVGTGAAVAVNDRGEFAQYLVAGVV
jgi:hypothetical protein